MKTVQRRIGAGLCVGILLVAAAAYVQEHNWYGKETEMETAEIAEAEPNEQDLKQSGQVEETLADADLDADLVFWYHDEKYKGFFEQSAKEYAEDYGVQVSIHYIDTMDYLGMIYDETMQMGNYPDAYLLTGDSLEEAYLYGIAAENVAADIYQNAVAENAVKASLYQDKMVGYPLSYNVCLFVYQQGYFDKEPESFQSIMEYSAENEPPENVAYLLEWNVKDAFFDFPMISNSVTFEKEAAEEMKVVYDETRYQEDLAYFEEMLESFSLDAEAVTEESVLNDFKEGKTLCAIIASDSLHELEKMDYAMMQIPDLNDSLEAKSAALTDLVAVNEFSEKAEMASDFAQYLTLTMSEELNHLSGSYSVKLSEDAEEAEEIAYEAYENAILVPSSQNAKEFWVNLETTILKYFE